MNWAKPASPTQSDRPVSSNSTYGTAMFWSQLPEFDARAPKKKIRKSPRTERPHPVAETGGQHRRRAGAARSTEIPERHVVGHR